MRLISSFIHAKREFVLVLLLEVVRVEEGEKIKRKAGDLDLMNKIIDSLSGTSLEECCWFYILMKLLEQIRYKEGFEHGLRFAKIYSDELKELRNLKLRFLKDILALYQDNMVPAIQCALSRMLSAIGELSLHCKRE